MNISKKMQRWGTAACLLVLPFILTGCGAERKAKKTARTFAQAYYIDLDFDVASKLATMASLDVINERREMVAMNPYAKKESPSLEFADFRFTSKDKKKAEFHYTVNGNLKRTLYLRRIEGKWKVDLQDEIREMSMGIQRLSDGGFGGFASAASGPVKYYDRDNAQRRREYMEKKKKEEEARKAWQEKQNKKQAQPAAKEQSKPAVEQNKPAEVKATAEDPAPSTETTGSETETTPTTPGEE